MTKAKSAELRSAVAQRRKNGESALSIAKDLKIHVSRVYAWEKKGEGKGGSHRAAIVYLRHAVRALKGQPPSRLGALVVLALCELEGK